MPITPQEEQIQAIQKEINEDKQKLQNSEAHLNRLIGEGDQDIINSQIQSNEQLQKKITEAQKKIDQLTAESSTLQTLTPAPSTTQPQMAPIGTKSPTASTQSANIKSADISDIVKKYTDMFKTEGKEGEKTWQKGFAEPKTNTDGSVSLTFKSQNEMTKFLSSAAQDKKAFVVSDNKGHVMGYSNGDGKLYHHNGKECNESDTLKASSTPIRDFQMPEPNSDTPVPRA